MILDLFGHDYLKANTTFHFWSTKVTAIILSDLSSASEFRESTELGNGWTVNDILSYIIVCLNYFTSWILSSCWKTYNNLKEKAS